MFSPVLLDAIDIELFPNISLFVKQGNNHILYKNSEVRLKHADISRLQSNKVEFIYVMEEHADEVRAYLEKNLVNILSNETLSGKSKNSIICPMLLNNVSDVFKDPDQAEALEKCKLLLQQLVCRLADNAELADVLSKIVNQGSYLLTHSIQVAVLSMYTHQALFNVDQDEILDAGIGGMLHDIGMLEVSGNILEKADTLSKHEYFRLRHHPKYSHDMLLKMGVTEPIPLTMALSHHERYNGTGYPNRLYENEIPRSALVAGICDVYCALTLERPYRPASTSEDALKTMKAEKNIFHPEIFAEFHALMSKLG
jgi:HD-GYP domain-containing protein (c-di-GMP phosphodiesterase class II)